MFLAALPIRGHFFTVLSACTFPVFPFLLRWRRGVRIGSLLRKTTSPPPFFPRNRY